ncbi:thioredoxin-disulfide reductase [Candidatus Peribacteria bacterium]|nr:thioredoxin-disulfide reductase [Candidatus Peribacteria bacterium]
MGIHSSMTHHQLIIVGSGPAGLTAAIYAARAELSPLVLEGMSPGGQLMTTTEVENFPGFAEGIQGPQLIAQMRQQAQRFGADTRMETVENVDFSDPLRLQLTTNAGVYTADSVILSTGARARWLGLPGEEAYWGKGYTACATCDGAFFRDKVVGVVGGGDSACEEAHFLTRFASQVHLFVRGEAFRASKPMQQRVLESEKITVHFNTQVTQLLGQPVLSGVELTDSLTQDTRVMDLQGLFCAIGHAPNTSVFGDFITLEDNKYFRVVDNTRSNIPSVFIAGDCGDWRYRQAITAAGYGCMAALDAEKYLTHRA